MTDPTIYIDHPSLFVRRATLIKQDGDDDAYLCVGIRCMECGWLVSFSFVEEILKYERRFDISKIMCVRCCMKKMVPPFVPPKVEESFPYATS